MRRATDHTDGETTDQRLDFADVSLSQLGPSPADTALTGAPLPAGDPRFLARDTARAAIEHAHATWREGRPRLIALTGPSGCGLSTVLNQIPSWLPGDTTALRIDLQHRPGTAGDALARVTHGFGAAPTGDAVDDAVACLTAQPPRLILVDNGHYLYSRLMGSNDGIRALHGLMVATQGHHLWLLACETQAWRRQCDATRTDRYFDDIIALDYLSRDDTATLLATRHPAAGDAALALDDDQIDAIFKTSRGHPALALHLAELAMRTNAGQIPAPFDESPLRELERTELLALAEISAHGVLTAADLQSIFRRDSQGINILLHHLHQCSLIAAVPREAAEPGYRLQPLLAPVINAHLVRANYLY
ncbi:MAG: ATP-binding protein [Proteobacteria bacterium]|nr:MAG: ATP-binding protein [Pseudomonadota bacterium]